MRQVFTIPVKNQPKHEPQQIPTRRPPPTLRADWKLTPPDDSGRWFPIAYLIGEDDGWDLFWSDNKDNPSGDAHGGVIDWPFGDDDWAGRKDFEALGFTFCY